MTRGRVVWRDQVDVAVTGHPKLHGRWPSKSAHFRVPGLGVVSGWPRCRGVVGRRLGILASPFDRGGAVIAREKRVLLRHYLEQARDVEGRDRAASGDQQADGVQLDRGGGAGPGGGQQGGEIRTPAVAALEVGSLQGDHRRPPGGVPEAERRAAVQRGTGGGLWGRIRSGEALRARGPTAGRGGADPEVSRPLRATKGRWTSRTSGCRGASGMR